MLVSVFNEIGDLYDEKKLDNDIDSHNLDIRDVYI